MKTINPAATEYMNSSTSTDSALGKDQNMDNATTSSKKHHFVLVHGVGQGAWNWYKVTTLLRSSGHQVTALDLAASGANPQNLSEVNTMSDYCGPLFDLMETLPNEQRVVLVGHSYGGMNIAYAMDRFPHKISVAVFLNALLPDTVQPPSYVCDRFLELLSSNNSLKDTQFSFDGNKTTALVGPNDISSLLRLSPPEDVTLFETLQRVGSTFQEDLATSTKFSQEGYGSVNRVYISTEPDVTLAPDFQRWMTQNFPVKEVKMIEDSDHFPMICKPLQVSQLLLDIAENYN